MKRQAGNGNAFIDERAVVMPKGEGPLSGLSFAVKDVFDIAGRTASAGNPDWLRSHGPAVRHAAAIDRLLASGAKLQGLTITDELMYSIHGENFHYGTPANPAAPGRIPGGSSSGSASAVAAGAADFAIGTDTGGSVRVPAAYCGLYGIRPTHGAVNTAGLIPLAPSFDTVGWFAKDAHTLLKVGEALIPEQSRASGVPFRTFVYARDLWELADQETIEALTPWVQLLCESADQAELEEITLAPEGLQSWMQAFRHLQGLEIWREHGRWVQDVQPRFGSGIAERFAWASTLVAEEQRAAYAKREEVRQRLSGMLAEGALILAPTVPGIAPLIGLSGDEVELARARTLQLSCPAGLAGLPQVTIPVMNKSELPVGLSLIAAHNRELDLLRWLVETVGAKLPV